MRHHSRRLGVVAILLFLIVPVSTAWSQRSVQRDCPDASFVGDYESRLFRAPSAATVDQLRALMNRPVQLIASAEWIDHPEARIETITDYHAVYPGTAEQFLAVAQDADGVIDYVPNLVLNDVVCTASDGTMRIQQRSEIHVLFLSISSELILDVRNDSISPGRGYTVWTLYDSLESDLVYSYGSFYAETVVIDGEPSVYVRHYARIGISTGIIGARAIIWANLDGQIVAWMDAVSGELARRLRGEE